MSQHAVDHRFLNRCPWGLLSPAELTYLNAASNILAASCFSKSHSHDVTDTVGPCDSMKCVQMARSFELHCDRGQES